MNWKLVSETCPKAWNEFGESKTCVTGWKIRDLYDHFDALGIVIQVGWHPDKAPQWMYVITSLYKGVPTGVADLKGYEFSTRTEAESAAFTRAFAHREAQITKPK